MMLQLTPELLILLIIDTASGRLRGKTLLQKRAFFLCLGLEYDTSYRAHYYGPYSPTIEGTLGRMKSLGFIDERSEGFGRLDRVGFEWRRYEFTLTQDGRKVLDLYERQLPQVVNAVRQYLQRMERAGDKGDYVTLSIAAKIIYIVQSKKKAMTYSEIRDTAQRLGWDIAPVQINHAVEFLERMELVQANDPEKTRN